MSPLPAVAVVLEVSMVIKPCLWLTCVAAGDSPATGACATKSQGFPIIFLRGPEKPRRSAEGLAAPGFRGRVTRGHTTNHAYPENDVPQPQDFDALGFTNTNPCCIKVSW